MALRLLAPHLGLTLETNTLVIGIALGVMGVMAAGAYFIMARSSGRGDEVQSTVARIIGGCLLIMLAGPIVNALVS